MRALVGFHIVRTLAVALVAVLLMSLSPIALSARVGRTVEQISVELHASNSASYAITIVESSQASSGRSTGRRQYSPWGFNYSVPGGASAVSKSWRFDVAEPRAQAGAAIEHELDSIIYLKIEWPRNGVVQKCSLKSPATYRVADHRFVVRLGDLAKLADSSGKPDSAKCTGN